MKLAETKKEGPRQQRTSKQDKTEKYLQNKRVNLFCENETLSCLVDSVRLIFSKGFIYTPVSVCYYHKNNEICGVSSKYRLRYDRPRVECCVFMTRVALNNPFLGNLCTKTHFGQLKICSVWPLAFSYLKSSSSS